MKPSKPARFAGTARSSHVHGTAQHGTARHGTARHGTARHVSGTCTARAIESAHARTCSLALRQLDLLHQRRGLHRPARFVTFTQTKD
jgi:hypothetical protein